MTILDVECVCVLSRVVNLNPSSTLVAPVDFEISLAVVGGVNKCASAGKSAGTLECVGQQWGCSSRNHWGACQQKTHQVPLTRALK